MSGPTITLFSNAHVRHCRRPARLFAGALMLLLAACGGDVETRMAEVRALQDVGQFQASIDELRDLLAIDPDLPEANYRLGLALVQTGEPSRAVWPLQKAADSSEYAITAGILLASTHFQTKNYDESIRAADRVLEADPERQAALRIRANAYLAARELDKALEDTTRLKELYPDDYGVRALHATVLADLGRLDEAEKEHAFVKQLGMQSDDPEFRIRACLAPAVFARDVLKDNEKARGFYEDCASRNTTDLVALNHIVSFFDEVGDAERGTEVIRNSATAAPENLPLQQALASRLNQVGKPDAAEQVLRKTVEDFGSASAWSGLADFYRGRKQPEKAIEALDKVIELSGGGNDALRFTQADTMIDMGDLDAARQVADQIQQPTYAALIRGRIALLSGDPQTALAAFEQGINAWPNNAGARYLAGLAARDLGDYERAISELREAVRSGNAETDAAIELSRIFLSQGRYQQALTFSAMALHGPRGAKQSDAYVVAARAATGQGQVERARSAIKQLDDLGYDAIAVRERAILERAVNGPDAAITAVEKSGLDLTDPDAIPALQQLVDALTSVDRDDEALARVEAALAAHPDRAELYELRGLVLGRSDRPAEAKAAFEKALALDPNRATSLTGLATVTANAGDVAKAIELFDRAYAIDHSDGTPAYSAAQLSLVSGNRDEAKRRLRDVVHHHPELPGAANDLAWLLAEDGEDLDTALALAKSAQKRNDSPEVLDTLGWVYHRRGEHTEAVETLQQAVAARSDSPSIRYHLGAALRAAGEEQQAKEMLTAALALGAFPEAEQARAELARLQP